MSGFVLIVALVLVLLAIAAIVFRSAAIRRRRLAGADVVLPVLALPARQLLALAPLVALALALVLSIRVVPVGHGLVIFNTLSRSFRLAPQGVTVIWPLISATELYDLRRLEYTMTGVMGEGRKANTDDSLWSPTREGLQVGIDLTLWHHIDPPRAIEIHQRWGPEYEDKFIRPALRSVIRLVISEFAVMDVYSAQRAKIQEEINVRMRALIEKEGFQVDEVVLRDVRFTEDFAKAIEAKQIAQQGAEQMRYTLEKEQREAERKVIEAQGRAKAIETINAALRQNPNYIRYLYVDKLSDKVSVIVADQPTIIDLNGFGLQK